MSIFSLSINLPFLNNSTSNNKKKNIILDPLTTIIRLGMYSYTEVGTKLSIDNSKIKFQSPNIVQGVKRKHNNDNKEDLHHLLIPIQVACNKYLNPNNHKNSIEIIFTSAIRGLKLLKQTYTDCLILNDCIDSYIQIINMSINNLNINNDNKDNKDNKDKIKNKSKDRIIDIDNNLLNEINLNDNNQEPYINVSNRLWNELQIETVINVIKLLELSIGDDKQNYIDCLNNLLIPIDEKVKFNYV